METNVTPSGSHSPKTDSFAVQYLTDGEDFYALAEGALTRLSRTTPKGFPLVDDCRPCSIPKHWRHRAGSTVLDGRKVLFRCYIDSRGSFLGFVAVYHDDRTPICERVRTRMNGSVEAYSRRARYDLFHCREDRFAGGVKLKGAYDRLYLESASDSVQAVLTYEGDVTERIVIEDGVSVSTGLGKLRAYDVINPEMAVVKVTAVRFYR